MKKMKFVVLLSLVLLTPCMLSACKGKDKEVGTKQEDNTVGEQSTDHISVDEESTGNDISIDEQSREESNSGTATTGKQEEVVLPEEIFKEEHPNTDKKEPDVKEEDAQTETGEESSSTREPIVLPGIKLD